MNKHNVSSFTCSYTEKDIRPNEKQFINKYFENTWHQITEEELYLFKEEFEKVNFSASIPMAILRGVISFIFILMIFIISAGDYSGWMLVVSFFISLTVTVILYVRDYIFGPAMSTADVCILPVYETAVGCYYNKGVKHEFYYASAFYGYDKKEFRISMNEVSDITDIMMVSVGNRTEFMPLKIKEHADRYRRSGIYVEYSGMN